MVSYEQKINDLETVLMAMHELGQKYYSEMVRLQGRISELEKSNKELDEKLNAAKIDYENQISKKEKAHSESLKRMCESYQGEVTKLQKGITHHLDKLDKVIQELEEKRHNLNKREIALSKDIENFKKEKDDWNTKKNAIIHQRDYYKDNFESLKKLQNNAQQEQNEVKKEESIDNHQEQDAEGKARAQEGDNSSPSIDNVEHADIHKELVQGTVQKDDASENLTIAKKSDDDIPKTIKLSDMK